MNPHTTHPPTSKEISGHNSSLCCGAMTTYHSSCCWRGRGEGKVCHYDLETVPGEHKFKGQAWRKGGNDQFWSTRDGEEGIPGKEERV